MRTYYIMYWHEIGVFLLLVQWFGGYRLEVSMCHGSRWVSFCLYQVPRRGRFGYAYNGRTARIYVVFAAARQRDRLVNMDETL
jgi:hypothetical protein